MNLLLMRVLLSDSIWNNNNNTQFTQIVVGTIYRVILLQGVILANIPNLSVIPIGITSSVFCEWLCCLTCVEWQVFNIKLLSQFCDKAALVGDAYHVSQLIR